MASRLKRSNCPKWFFFSENNKIFMYLLAPFILQIFKRILRADPELSGCVIFGNKMAHLFWKFFFGTNHCYYFYLPVGPLHCVKFTKNSYSGSKVMRMGPKWSICPRQFFWKIIIIITPSIAQNFKKILPVDPELWGCAIFGHKMTHLPRWEFFRKPVNVLMNLVPFIHTYLHAKNQSEILIY